MPNRPGKTGRGGSGRKSGGANPAMLGLMGVQGGQYTPGQDAESLSAANGGASAVSTPNSISPATIKHPILDAIFNGGRGSLSVLEQNAANNRAMYEGGNRLDVQGLQNQGQLGVQGLRNSGDLAVGKQTGENALALSKQNSQGQIEVARAAAVDNWMKVHNLMQTPENIQAANKALFSPELANAVAQTANESSRLKGEGSYLGSKQGQSDIGTGTAASILAPVGINMKNTALQVDPNALAIQQGLPRASSFEAYGSRPGGVSSTTTSGYDQATQKTTTSVDTKNIPGIPGSFNTNVVPMADPNTATMPGMNATLPKGQGINFSDPSNDRESDVSSIPASTSPIPPIDFSKLGVNTANPQANPLNMIPSSQQPSNRSGALHALLLALHGAFNPK